MTTAQLKRTQIRKQLVETAADPFLIAAEALARNQELRARIQELEALLQR